MSSASFQTINPANGEPIESFAYFSPSGTEETLRRSQSSFKDFRRLPTYRRAELLTSLAAALRKNKESRAATITREMGKIIGEAEAEVDKCAQQADWYAEHGPSMLAKQAAHTGRIEAFVSYLPLGPILAVMPWNFPAWQVTRFCLPSLLAGNTVLLKHSPNTQRCGLELQRVMLEAGFPEGVFQNLILQVAEVAGVIRDPRVAGVSVTGSVRAGSAVAAEAGGAFKPNVLELGGSDSFIVLKDADVPKAVQAAVQARFSNAGQVCLAAKRFFLAREIAEEFEERFIQATDALKVGDPCDRTQQLGPMARGDLLDGLQQQVKQSITMGARVLSEGGPLQEKGFFFRPTVLADVRPGVAVFDGETFGPVAAIARVTDHGEAIALTNTSEYGLSANVWTRDVPLALAMTRELEVGGVFINGIAASNSRVPIRRCEEERLWPRAVTLRVACVCERADGMD